MYFVCDQTLNIASSMLFGIFIPIGCFVQGVGQTHSFRGMTVPLCLSNIMFIKLHGSIINSNTRRGSLLITVVWQTLDQAGWLVGGLHGKVTVLGSRQAALLSQSLPFWVIGQKCQEEKGLSCQDLGPRTLLVNLSIQVSYLCYRIMKHGITLLHHLQMTRNRTAQNR